MRALVNLCISKLNYLALVKKVVCYSVKVMKIVLNEEMVMRLYVFQCYTIVYFLSRLHLHSGYYYYDYEAIDVVRKILI